jgi:Fibronectin type III domain
MRNLFGRRVGSATLVAALFAGVFLSAPAQALVRVAPSTVWGHTYAGTSPAKSANATSTSKPRSANIDAKSKFIVNYRNFPEWAKLEVQAAIDIWSANFQSSVPITLEATWGRSSSWGVLGSARPGNYYSGFEGAPDASLWYPSALANALAKKDLDKVSSEMIIQVNSTASWNQRGDSTPTSREYDLESVMIHELAHGLGFLSNSTYDSYFSFGSIDDPTPFDAYTQMPDGTRLADLASPSLELGSALQNDLVWGGPIAVKANGDVKPKLFTPNPYEGGSSVSHLDEKTFSKSGFNSVMTPNLDAGEVFDGPGPLLLAMMEDMRNKPPVGIATVIPQTPRNVRAIVSDSSAIVTFDAPVNIRTAQISTYVVKNLKTGVEKKSITSPVLMTGLKNGTSYTFSVYAINSIGSSVTAQTDPVIPQPAWKATVIDSTADGKSAASTTFNSVPTLAYTDSKSGALKLAMLNEKVWKKITVDGTGGTAGRTKNPITGQISMCVNGTGTKQLLHIFYSDSVDKDLRYATYDGKKFTFEVVDGNALLINKFEDPIRVRGSSDVSVTNACVASATGIQVFYRDESQGILLGAVKKKGEDWNYELVDGDRKTDDRTTGDVAFHLRALGDGGITYVMYDSVLVVNQKKEATSGAVRVATRTGLDENTWSYKSLDFTDGAVAVAGYDVSLAKVSNGIQATWMTATALTVPKAENIRWALLGAPAYISQTSGGAFGTPGANIVSDGKQLAFECEARICVFDYSKASPAGIKLVTTAQNPEPLRMGWVTVSKVKYLLASVNGKLSLLKP